MLSCQLAFSTLLPLVLIFYYMRVAVIQCFNFFHYYYYIFIGHLQVNVGYYHHHDYHLTRCKLHLATIHHYWQHQQCTEASFGSSQLCMYVALFLVIYTFKEASIVPFGVPNCYVLNRVTYIILSFTTLLWCLQTLSVTRYVGMYRLQTQVNCIMQRN